MSRRTVLTAVIALSAFGLTAGLTASLGVSTDQLGANTVAVAACDADGIALSYGVTNGTNVVDTVTLSDVASLCDGQTVTVTLLNGTTALETVSATVAQVTGSQDLDFTSGVDAANVSNVAVVITG